MLFINSGNAAMGTEDDMIDKIGITHGTKVQIIGKSYNNRLAIYSYEGVAAGDGNGYVYTGCDASDLSIARGAGITAGYSKATLRVGHNSHPGSNISRCFGINER